MPNTLKLGPLEEKLLDMLRRSSLPLSTGVLCERSGKDRGAVRKSLNRMCELGLITSRRPDPREKAYIWTTQ